MPEVEDEELEAAKEEMDRYGDDWFDLEGGRTAFDRLQQMHYRKMGEQFVRDFLPTIPEAVRNKRAVLVSDIEDVLKKCRTCKSWDENSESKLGRWIDHIPEEMIPYTSLPNLLRIREGLGGYLEVHTAEDAKNFDQE